MTDEVDNKATAPTANATAIWKRKSLRGNNPQRIERSPFAKKLKGVNVDESLDI